MRRYDVQASLPPDPNDQYKWRRNASYIVVAADILGAINTVLDKEPLALIWSIVHKGEGDQILIQEDGADR